MHPHLACPVREQARAVVVVVVVAVVVAEEVLVVVVEAVVWVVVVVVAVLERGLRACRQDRRHLHSKPSSACFDQGTPCRAHHAVTLASARLYKLYELMIVASPACLATHCTTLCFLHQAAEAEHDHRLNRRPVVHATRGKGATHWQVAHSESND